VLAPHADDESFGCGGTISARRAAGDRVVIVVATDGARSDRLGRDGPEVAAVRQDEARAAGRQLGVDPEDVRFLQLPDGSLQEHHAELVERLCELVAALDPVEILVCSEFDPHPDHLALHRALLEVPTRARVLEYLVWAWPTWPAGALRMMRAECGTRRGLVMASLRLQRRLRKSCVAKHRDQKRAAISCYDSQLGDGRPGRGVPPEMAAAYDGRWELLIVRPGRLPA
jgi:LmbE family N-acetylglucosaminyl deacetylase